MAIAFQLLVIFLVLLIAYWWANQGFLSSLLHFVAVVCAGAIALALWEPLVVGVFLPNAGWFDKYTWGFTLVALFLIFLLIFRISFDKLVPGNVFLPRGADLVGGGLFGLGSGILTVGILLLGVGMVQSADKFLQMSMWHRIQNPRPIAQTDENGEEQALWLPAHTLTTRFYELLSVGSLYPELVGEPMARVNPELDRQAFSLLRDGYKQGTSSIVMNPDAIVIDELAKGPSHYFVRFTVDEKGFDRSEQFICSAAQVRVIAVASDGRHVDVAFPQSWRQQVNENNRPVEKTFRFDDTSHYMTSIPGQKRDVSFTVVFAIGNAEGDPNVITTGYVPKYIQIKGTRFDLPAPTNTTDAGPVSSRVAAPPITTGVPVAAASDISQRFDIRPVTTTINSIIGFEHTNRYLTEGTGTFKKGARGLGNRETAVHGIYAPEGSEIVQVDVSRSSTTSMYPARDLEPNGTPILIDDIGRKYLAKGFILDRPIDAEVRVDPSNLITSISMLPHLPTSDQNKLRLFFEVTEGAHIVAFQIGEITVASCDLTVVFK